MTMQTQHGYTDQGQLRPLTATAPAGFPYVLISILENESPEIITWSSTGRAFGIRNMAAFKTKILPQYFKHDKFSSFQRQLNLYGFRKIVKGRESGCYIHCYFQRGHPELLKQVRRGQVPPCPPRYERKVYGCSTRPRQGAGSALDGTARTSDSSSDSEPEMRRAFDAAPPRQVYGGAGGYGAAHAHSHLQQHVQQQPPPGGVDGAPWDGSFREQMERRETSSRRVTKLFPGRSTPLGAAFGAPAPAYTAPLDAPVQPHAQQHAMAFNGAPAFGYGPGGYGGFGGGGGGGAQDGPVRSSFCAMLGALEQELRMNEVLGGGGGGEDAGAMAAAPPMYGAGTGLTFGNGGLGGGGGGGGGSGSSSGSGAAAGADLTLFERPGFGSQLLDMAYELRDSRGGGAGDVGATASLLADSGDLLSLPSPPAPAMRDVLGPADGGGRSGGSSMRLRSSVTRRHSLMELLRSVDTQAPPAKRRRVSAASASGCDARNSGASTAALTDSDLPLPRGSALRTSILTALMAINQEPAAAAAPPAAGGGGGGGGKAGREAGVNEEQQQQPAEALPSPPQRHDSGMLDLLWPEQVRRRSTLADWMDSYFLDNAIKDLEASWEMSPAAVPAAAPAPAAPAPADDAPAAAAAADTNGGANGVAAAAQQQQQDAAAAAAEEKAADAAATAAANVAVARTRGLGGSGTSDTDTARLRGSIFVLLNVLANAKDEEDEGAFEAAFNNADLAPEPLAEAPAKMQQPAEEGTLIGA